MAHRAMGNDKGRFISNGSITQRLKIKSSTVKCHQWMAVVMTS